MSAPRFLVDNPLNDELEGYEVFKNLNRSSTTAIVGVSGSGKTSFMYSLITNKKPKIFRKQFENIIVVMPRASRNSLKSNVFDKYIEERSLFDTLSENVILEINRQVQENADKKQHTLLILDDVATALKNPMVAKTLQHLVYAYRHFRLNILMLVQTLKTIPLPIRKNLTNLIVFHKPRVSEWESMVTEFLELEKDITDQLYKTLFQNKYDWALINLNSGRVFKKFDEVVYREDDD